MLDVRITARPAGQTCQTGGVAALSSKHGPARDNRAQQPETFVGVND
jgi:hypothetical protein